MFTRYLLHSSLFIVRKNSNRVLKCNFFLMFYTYFDYWHSDVYEIAQWNLLFIQFNTNINANSFTPKQIILLMFCIFSDFKNVKYKHIFMRAFEFYFFFFK